MIVEYALTLEQINTSAQVGDILYYVPTALVGGFDQGDGNILVLGIVNSIGENIVTFLYDSVNSPPIPTQGDFVMFAKDTNVNTTSLLGYYASVKFTNDSSREIELFSVGSEVTESSK